jgi:hypothetical protein
LLFIFAKKSWPCYFRLLQHNRPLAAAPVGTGEQLKYMAYGVKQPNIFLIIVLTALGILPGVIAVMLLTKHYFVGLTDRRFIVLPVWGSGEINVKKITDYRLDRLPQVFASTGPIFTHIKILDPVKPFVAKFHRYAP